MVVGRARGEELLRGVEAQRGDRAEARPPEVGVRLGGVWWLGWWLGVDAASVEVSLFGE